MLGVEEGISFPKINELRFNIQFKEAFICSIFLQQVFFYLDHIFTLFCRMNTIYLSHKKLNFILIILYKDLFKMKEM